MIVNIKQFLLAKGWTKFVLFLLFLLFSTKAISQYYSWLPTKGPYGGRITDLALNSMGHIFAGTYRGIFRSVRLVGDG